MPHYQNCLIQTSTVITYRENKEAQREAIIAYLKAHADQIDAVFHVRPGINLQDHFRPC